MPTAKILLAAGAAAFGLALSAGAALADPGEATASVNVRAGPGTGYPVVDVLSPGEAVDIGPCKAGWCHVSHPGPDGWVSANYLAGAAYEPVPIYEEPPDYYTPPPAIYVQPPFFHHHRHRVHVWPGGPINPKPPGTWPHPPGGNPPGNWHPPVGGTPKPGGPIMRHPHPGGGGNFCQLNPTVCQNHKGQYKTP